jgi:hypothetical protein
MAITLVKLPVIHISLFSNCHIGTSTQTGTHVEENGEILEIFVANIKQNKICL